MYDIFFCKKPLNSTFSNFSFMCAIWRFVASFTAPRVVDLIKLIVAWYLYVFLRKRIFTDGRTESDPVRIPFFPFEIRNHKNRYVTIALVKRFLWYTSFFFSLVIFEVRASSTIKHQLTGHDFKRSDCEFHAHLVELFLHW